MVFQYQLCTETPWNNIQGEYPVLHCLQQKKTDEEMIKGDDCCWQTLPNLQYDTKLLPMGSMMQYWTDPRHCTDAYKSVSTDTNFRFCRIWLQLQNDVLDCIFSFFSTANS